MNMPYGASLVTIAQEIFSPDALRRLQHVGKELNTARPTQVAAGVPTHEAAKIALGTLLGVSYKIFFFLAFVVYFKIHV